MSLNHLSKFLPSCTASYEDSFSVVLSAELAKANEDFLISKVTSNYLDPSEA